MKVKAFVTGAGGYIGQSLIGALQAKGYEVRGLGRNPARSHNLVEMGVDAVIGDIRYPETIEGLLDGMDVVFHLAGTMIGYEREIFRLNVEGTGTIVNAAANAGVKTLVFASSGTVYGDHGDAVVTEISECRPHTAYGRSKLEAERLVNEGGREGALPGITCRLGGVYGPRSQMMMLQNAGHSQVRLLGKGDNWISVIHVADVANALVAAAERGRPGEMYNIVDDKPAYLKDFYSHFARRLGGPEAKHISEANAKRLAKIVGFFGRVTGRSVVFNADFVKMIFSSLRLSNERMREQLGVDLRYSSYREGLDSVLAEMGAIPGPIPGPGPDPGPAPEKPKSAAV